MNAFIGKTKQDEIIMMHKTFQKELFVIKKFLETVLKDDVMKVVVGVLLKEYILIEHKDLYSISQKHIEELASLSERSETPDFFDIGKNCVYKTMGYCVNEELD